MSFSCEKAFVNTQGIHGIPLKCLCGRDVTIFTSKTQDNPGRPFFRCPSKKDDHLFKWVEEAVFEEVETKLPKLGLMEMELCNVKCEVEEMRALIEALKNDGVRSKMIQKLLCVLLCLVVIGILYLLVAKTKEKNKISGY